MEALAEVITRDGCPQLGWILGPQFRQTKQEMEYLAEGLAALGLLVRTSFPDNDSSSWQLWAATGLWVYTLSATDPTKLANRAPDWVLITEAAQCPAIVLRRADARLTPRHGWCALAGTLEHTRPEGEWYAEVIDAWATWPNRYGGVSYILPAWSNPSLYPGGAADPKVLAARRRMAPDDFAERLEGRRIRPKARVMHEFDRALHVAAVSRAPRPPADPAVPWLPPDTAVDAWVDPAGGQWAGASAYAVVAAALGRCPWCDQPRVLLLDELYLRHLDARRVIAAARERWWWPRVRRVIMDFAGRQQHGATEDSHTSIWRAPVAAGGAGLPVVADRVPLAEGNRRVAALLAVDPVCGHPHLLFDPHCEKGIWEFGTGYRLPQDANGDPVPGPPLDRDNHFVAAVRYGVTFYFPALGRGRAGRRRPTPYIPPWRRERYY